MGTDEVKLDANAEINEALKVFEEKSSKTAVSPKAISTQTVDTSIGNKEKKIEFETDSYRAVKFYSETDTPKIVRLAMKVSGVKEQRTAEYILFGLVIVAILVSLYLFFVTGIKTLPKTSPELLERMKQIETPATLQRNN